MKTFDDMTPLAAMMPYEENILWHSKPYMPCFILESIFNPLAPFALIWLLFDTAFIYFYTNNFSTFDGTIYFMIIFFLIHLLPVWIYLGGILMSLNKYKNTEFFITDKAIYASGGFFSMYCTRIDYKDVKYVSIERGLVDKMLGVGDVVIRDKQDVENSYTRLYRNNFNTIVLSICDVYDYMEVYKMITEQKARQ